MSDSAAPDIHTGEEVVDGAEGREDILQVRGSAALRTFLDDLRAAKHIIELVDGYRLCIATACAFQRAPDTTRTYRGRQTMFARDTLDTGDQAIRTAIAEIYPDVARMPYRAAEDLAEQGAEIIKGFMVGDNLKFMDIVERVERAAQEDETS